MGIFCLNSKSFAELKEPSFDDLTAADVNADVSLMPNSKAGDVRHGANGSGFLGVIVHLVCADIRHPMGMDRFDSLDALVAESKKSSTC